MIDVKKLFTGFLILATIAVCSGVVLSLVTNSSKPTSTATTAGPDIEGSSSAVPTNAFVDTGSIQGNAAELLSYVDTTSTDAEASDPDNLTNIVANSFVAGLDTSNPSGMQLSATGTPEINPPDVQLVAEQIASSSAVADFVAPNWDAEAQSQLIKTYPGATPSDITQYGNSLTSIFNKYFVSSGLQSQVSNTGTADPSQLSYISSQVQSALNDTLALQTPASLAPLQQSIVRVMVYEKNFAALGETSNDDPVKASLTLEAEKTKYDTAVTNLQQQVEKASSMGLSLNDNPKTSTPFVAMVLGISSAQAQWITFDPTAFAQMIEEYVNNIILQILKNTLVSLIQKKILTAIQGSGAPKFVTSFATQMVTSFQSGAVSAINSDITQTPPSQQGLLRQLTTSPFVPANAASVLGTIGPALGATGTFTNMSDYLSLYNSGGNYWANAMAIHDDAMAAGAGSAAAKQTQNIAQQGYNDSETCDDGSDPNGYSLQCDDDLPPYSNGSCPDANPPQWLPNDGLCTDGTQPQIIAPGQVFNQTSEAALNIGSANITSATDIAGLLDALLTSLLNTVAQNAINYSNSAVNGVLNTQNPSNTGLTGIAPATLTSTSTSAATQVPVQCLPSIQSVSISTSTGIAYVNVSATGGRVDTTCVATNSCPTTENADGTPIYNWNAPGAVATLLTGQTLTFTYSTPGTYSATVTASTDNSQSTCQINIQ